MSTNGRAGNQLGWRRRKAQGSIYLSCWER
ncbi:hypothetical protein GQ600_24907 [Phytophthora cactorum]|nr:hypothetical protein GQ600_24907 [Phytophthora cactorum]